LDPLEGEIKKTKEALTCHGCHLTFFETVCQIYIDLAIRPFFGLFIILDLATLFHVPGKLQDAIIGCRHAEMGASIKFRLQEMICKFLYFMFTIK